MKQLLTLLLCALCLASCEKQPAEVGFADKEVEMLNDGKEATYKGKPWPIRAAGGWRGRRYRKE